MMRPVRFTVALLVALSLLPLQAAPQEQVQITLDRQEYAPGVTGQLRLVVPATLRGDLSYAFLFLRPAGSSEKGRWLSPCGWPITNGADKPCAWEAPAAAGNYEVYLTGAVTSNVNTVFATARFRVTGGVAPIQTGRQEPRRSLRGHMTVFLSGPTAVLGEEIRVQVTVPAPKEGEPRSGRLDWSIATTGWEAIRSAKAEWVARGADEFASAFRNGGTEEQRVLAPWGAPGRYHLRLFRGNDLIDAIEIPVTKGWLEGGVVPSRKIYQVGDSIDFTVTLPPNRHYYGHWAGPTVHLFPLELDGKPVPKEKAIEMVTGCLVGCGGWLASIAADRGQRNTYDGGTGIKPGMYSISRATAVGSTRPFDAVSPGRYELRLYDRGPDQPFKDYVDLYFAVSDPIVIEPAGATPSELIFARLKVAPLQSTGRGARPTGLGAAQGGRTGTQPAAVHGSRREDYEPLAEVTIGEAFYVVAIFNATPNVVEPAERTVTLDWLVNDARQSRTLTLKRKSPGLYVSIPLLPAFGGGGL